MTETWGEMGGRVPPTPPAKSQQLHGCPERCHQNHTHAHTHPGGHYCTWEYGDCTWEPETSDETREK
jgi:hypothetical protein